MMVNTNYQYVLVQSCDVIFYQDDLKKSLHSLCLRNFFLRSIGDKGQVDHTKTYWQLV